MFCYDELLETIQLSQVNGDNSEKFVKMKTLDSPDNIWRKFSDLKEKNKDLKDNVEELENFLKENFDNDTLQPCKVTDYKEMGHPQNIITDGTYLEFYRLINRTWENLGVKTNEIPEEVSDRHSMIELPNYFIKVRKI